MKKRKILLILAAMLAFNCMPVYVAEAKTANLQEVEKNVLTVDEAVSKAIAHSRTLKTMYENNRIDKLDEKDTRRDLINASEYVEITNLSVELKRLMDSLTNYNENVEIEKEKIRLNVIEVFSAIINAENSLELYDKQIELNERDLKIAEVRKNLGLISETEYNALVLSIKQVKSSKKNLEIALEEAYTSLNNILGQNLSRRYIISLDIEYEPLGDVNLEFEVAKAVSSSRTVKQAEEAATIAKYQLDVYSSLYSPERKEKVQNNYSQAARTLSDTKTNMETGVRQVYNNIQTTETAYKNNIDNLEQKKKELEIKKVQLQTGKITQLDYDKAEFEIEQLENTINQSVYSHYVLVCRFNDPDLI